MNIFMIHESNSVSVPNIYVWYDIDKFVYENKKYFLHQQGISGSGLGRGRVEVKKSSGRVSGSKFKFYKVFN